MQDIKHAIKDKAEKLSKENKFEKRSTPVLMKFPQ